MIRCKLKGYTPLDKVAASRTENEYILESDAKVAELLIRSSVKELVNSRNNFERLSPLSLHVKAMSMLQSRIKPLLASSTRQRQGPNVGEPSKQHLHRASKVVLGAMAPHSSLEVVSEALETLYSCNSLIIMDMISQEEKRTRQNVLLDFGKQARGRSAAGHWIWEWLLDLLAVLHTRTAADRHAPFHALHLISNLPNCPPPFLLLAMRAYPYDIKTPDPSSGNLPLHNVAAWAATSNVPSTVRKYMCIESLSMAHEEGLALANAAGKTPVDLDNEAGTNLLDLGTSVHDKSSGDVEGEYDEEEEGDDEDDETSDADEDESEFDSNDDAEDDESEHVNDNEDVFGSEDRDFV